MKNKKILGALAALCMGIILCVSSVFAVNYWYTIDNDDAASNTVTMGNALTIELTDAIDDEKYLYPGGTVTFGEITVTGVLDWKYNTPANETQTGGIANVELPKFALRVKAITESKPNLKDEFTVYSNFDKNGNDAFNDLGVLGVNQLILDDLQEQTNNGEIAFTIRLAFAEDAPATFADSTLSFTLEVVAYIGDNYADALANRNGAKILMDADADTEDEIPAEEDSDGVAENADPAVDPTTALA